MTEARVSAAGKRGAGAPEKRVPGPSAARRETGRDAKARRVGMRWCRLDRGGGDSDPSAAAAPLAARPLDLPAPSAGPTLRAVAPARAGANRGRESRERGDLLGGGARQPPSSVTSQGLRSSASLRSLNPLLARWVLPLANHGERTRTSGNLIRKSTTVLGEKPVVNDSWSLCRSSSSYARVVTLRRHYFPFSPE